MNPKFTVGQTVWRIEARETTQATVITIGDYDELMGWNYEISYIEGGSGWWPESALSETVYPAP